MTEREALKMAIEFLEDNQHHVADNERHAYVMEYNSVIEMCKEALAQPEQEPVDITNHVSDEDEETCPNCGKPLQSKRGGGVVCSARCGYWFCF